MNKPTVSQCWKGCTHYCGRPQSYHKAQPIPGRGPVKDYSRFGNPFPMRDESERAEVISKYRAWLWERLEQNFHQEVEDIDAIPEGAVLGCFCAPKPCHCDEIVRAWVMLKSIPKGQ
jgi:hypothetical protein